MIAPSLLWNNIDVYCVWHFFDYSFIFEKIYIYILSMQYLFIRLHFIEINHLKYKQTHKKNTQITPPVLFFFLANWWNTLFHLFGLTIFHHHLGCISAGRVLPTPTSRRSFTLRLVTNSLRASGWKWCAFNWGGSNATSPQWTRLSMKNTWTVKLAVFSHSKHPVSFVKTPVVWHMIFYKKKVKSPNPKFDIDPKWHSFKNKPLFFFGITCSITHLPKWHQFLRSRSSKHVSVLPISQTKILWKWHHWQFSIKFCLVVFQQPIWKICDRQIGSWNPKKSGWK